MGAAIFAGLFDRYNTACAYGCLCSLCVFVCGWCQQAFYNTLNLPRTHTLYWFHASLHDVFNISCEAQSCRETRINTDTSLGHKYRHTSVLCGDVNYCLSCVMCSVGHLYWHQICGTGPKVTYHCGDDLRGQSQDLTWVGRLYCQKVRFHLPL